ncbi:MAG: acid phosphatase [Candidatus Accumulibacter phosphatis]|uniref:Acid phosphatase n=1 Tax=Candidatus Accumulibacter phosphatis TaxID=327160 RepID=A0A6A7RT12_9PROT|nr:acid phosphatase [Candidatus Accumulibacter phosphatis]
MSAIMKHSRWLAPFVSVAAITIGTLTAVGYLLFSAPNRVQLTVPSATTPRISFFALGDQGSGQIEQWKVARSMESVAERTGALDFVILLGDNFYGPELTSIHDLQWNWKFESVYSGWMLATIPFYALLGNHDVPADAQVEIRYAQDHAGSGRWQMPGHYYSRDFGSDDGHPLLRVVFIDSNQLEPGDLDKQIHFVEDAFSSDPGRQATWRIVVAHHPIRHFGIERENAVLVSQLLPVLQKYHVDLYMSGHDHNQQFIVRDGEPYYVISGGGGKKLEQLPTTQGNGLPFTALAYGFSSVAVDASRMVISYFDDDARMLSHYAIERRCSAPASTCLQPAIDDDARRAD